LTDKDTFLARGVSPYALVNEQGIALDGSATLAQLMARGLQPICSVSELGIADSGSTLAQLRARGIEPCCVVNESGLASGGSTLANLRARGITAMCPVDANGIAEGGTLSADGLLKRGIQALAAVTEAGAWRSATLLPLNSPLVVLGDSITAARGFAGFCDWAHLLTGGRFAIKTVAAGPTGWNQGVVGNTTTQMIARLSNVTAESPKLVVVMGGCNDITNSGGTFTSVTTNLRTIIDTLKAAGIKVVLCTIIPGNTSTVYIGAMETIRTQVNAWITSQTDVIVADTSAAITNIATQLQADGKHPNGTGSQLIGTVVANAITPKLVPTTIFDGFPYTDLSPNGAFAGGASVATSWTFFQAANGLTKTASKSTMDGIVTQKYVASGTCSSNVADNFNSNVVPPGGLTGQNYDALVEIIVTKATGLAGIAVGGGTNNTNNTHMSILSQDSAALSVPFRGVMRCAQSALAADGGTLNARVSFIPAVGACDIEIDIRRFREWRSVM